MINSFIQYSNIKREDRSYDSLDLIWTLGVGASTRGWLLLRRLQIDRGLARTFCLVSGLLCGTAAHGVEHGL